MAAVKSAPTRAMPAAAKAALDTCLATSSKPPRQPNSALCLRTGGRFVKFLSNAGLFWATAAVGHLFRGM